MSWMSLLCVVGLACVCGCAAKQTAPVALPGQGSAKVATRPVEKVERPAVIFPPATLPAEPTNIYAFTMKDIDGRDRNLSEFRGRVVLVVNVASKCGFTPQYAGLQKLYDDYKDRGLVVLGVPSNEFRQQEPGTEAEIKAFCTRNYGVTFPLLAKVSVRNGPLQAELYRYLAHKSRNGVLDADVSWNFNKFLVGRDGRPIRHYESKITPDNPGLRADIEAALR